MFYSTENETERRDFASDGSGSLSVRQFGRSRWGYISNDFAMYLNKQINQRGNEERGEFAIEDKQQNWGGILGRGNWVK